MGLVWCSRRGSEEHEAWPFAAAGATAQTRTVCLSWVATRPPGRLETTGAGEETLASLREGCGVGWRRLPCREFGSDCAGRRTGVPSECGCTAMGTTVAHGISGAGSEEWEEVRGGCNCSLVKDRPAGEAERSHPAARLRALVIADEHGPRSGFERGKARSEVSFGVDPRVSM